MLVTSSTNSEVEPSSTLNSSATKPPTAISNLRSQIRKGVVYLVWGSVQHLRWLFPELPFRVVLGPSVSDYLAAASQTWFQEQVVVFLPEKLLVSGSSRNDYATPNELELQLGDAYYFLCAEELHPTNKVSRYYDDLRGDRYQILDLTSQPRWLLDSPRLAPYQSDPRLERLIKEKAYPNQLLGRLLGEIEPAELSPELLAERFLLLLSNCRDAQSLEQAKEFLRQLPRQDLTYLFLPVGAPKDIGKGYVSVSFFLYYCGASGLDAQNEPRGRATGLVPFLLPFLRAFEADHRNLAPLELFCDWIYLSNRTLATSYQTGLSYQAPTLRSPKSFFIPNFSRAAKDCWLRFVQMLES